mmetsp:Transcript_8427/g.23707  ORF Transcript_8427/g.23707 Transcript_8427/m.23707 type:complete len:396 (+) Transcript_8427:56-1243(+)
MFPESLRRCEYVTVASLAFMVPMTCIDAVHKSSVNLRQDHLAFGVDYRANTRYIRTEHAQGMLDRTNISNVPAYLTEMLQACDPADTDQLSILFSGLWVMKQLLPEVFQQHGLSVVRQRLPQFTATKLDTEVHCGETISNSIQADLDMWYFTEMPGGLGPPVLRPNPAWLRCALQSMKSLDVHVRLKAGNADEIAPLSRFIFAMELADVTKAWMNASQANNAFNYVATDGHVGSAASWGAELSSVWQDAEALCDAMDRLYLRDDETCDRSPIACGYYLTHRALLMTGLFSHPLQRQDYDTAREIGRALRRHTMLYLRGRPQPLDAHGLDLAGEVLMVLKNIVLVAGTPTTADKMALAEVADMVQSARVPIGDCHASVVYYFSRDASHEVSWALSK